MKTEAGRSTIALFTILPLDHESPRREFHVSRESREKYRFSEDIFSISGRVIFGSFHSARVFAQKINDTKTEPGKHVNAGEIYAAGLLHEILHYLITIYLQKNPETWDEALTMLSTEVGEEQLNETVHRFTAAFPPSPVHRRETSVDDYLAGRTSGIPNRVISLEEIILLRLSNENPALSGIGELFDDEALRQATIYLQIIAALEKFFEGQPKFGPGGDTLIELLRKPARSAPYSIVDQLTFIRESWGSLLGDKFAERLLRSLDFIKEEEKAMFLRFQGPSPGEPLLEPIDYTGLEHEPEKFSQDLDWMPKVVLMAKSALVWLDQLSSKYQRSITRLDQIPDEELDMLSRWGFSGLWLIGLWQRSEASKRIKQMMGNPDAEASAYSLYDYIISDELGGYEAYEHLKHRCWQRGIRLASDMVPNHTGIDGKWVVEHPDWFVQLSYPPYPSYSFNGPNLSNHSGIGLYLEDHYYDRSDAAVIFKRVDFGSGDTRFIYHGNDGTSMPWNDTAQLNYLNAEVREAVIQTILHVARMFPIIRFDAAMIMAKKHYQRLWFPEPGSGGGIPSRAEHGLTKRQFDEAMPIEFWREVVERVQKEVPDTLLLAEAFWFMEGYFVRSLGMHRVYNSAFMNMLKREENAKYRKVIRDTLEFDPEILKRYVNFMNNPDEETAIAQFGKDDKYFGVCMMMVTMPGLPMFGHGQVEGFTEKYGMEYRRAMWREEPDHHLIHRHEREIFPLMKKRYLFAGVDHFALYDFFSPEGHLNENVFAYSNRVGEERALVVYNNKFEEALGWIHRSTPYLVKDGDNRHFTQKTLGEGLGLHPSDDHFTIFRDHVNGLEFIRSSRDLSHNGMFVSLGAFKYQVFIDFREVHDRDGQYRRLAEELNGRGAESIDRELRKMVLRPVHNSLVEILKLDELAALFAKGSPGKDFSADEFISENQDALAQFYQSAIHGIPRRNTFEKFELSATKHRLKTLLNILVEKDLLAGSKSKALSNATTFFNRQVSESTLPLRTLFLWALFEPLESLFAEGQPTVIDHLMLDHPVSLAWGELASDGSNHEMLALCKVLLRHGTSLSKEVPKSVKDLEPLESIFSEPTAQHFLQVNEHDGKWWYDQEAFEALAWHLFAARTIDAVAKDETPVSKRVKMIEEAYGTAQAWLAAEEESNYQVRRLLEALEVNGKNAPKKVRSKKKASPSAKRPSK